MSSFQGCQKNGRFAVPKKVDKRVRRSKDSARDKILKESLKLIGRNGWAGLSFQTIAKSCGMSASNIVYHFESKESLLMALLDHISENNWRIVHEGIRPEFDSLQRLLTHFQKNLEW